MGSWLGKEQTLKDFIFFNPAITTSMSGQLLPAEAPSVMKCFFHVPDDFWVLV